MSTSWYLRSLKWNRNVVILRTIAVVLVVAVLTYSWSLMTVKEAVEPLVVPTRFLLAKSPPSHLKTAVSEGAALLSSPSKNSPSWSMPLLILITSDRRNFQKRDAVRQTWGNATVLKKVLGDGLLGPYFFIGEPELGEKEAEADKKVLRTERQLFDDVVQVAFVDRYRKLTAKIVHVFKWARDKLHKQPNNGENYYILKADDDAYVNVIELVNVFYNEFKKAGPKDDKFYCRTMRATPVDHDSNSQWYVSKELLDRKYYPTFCSGSAYLFQANMLEAIMRKVGEMKLLPNEDTFFTGTVAEALGFQHQHFRAATFGRAGNWTAETLCQYGSSDLHLMIHQVAPHEMFRIHHCTNFMKNKSVAPKSDYQKLIS